MLRIAVPSMGGPCRQSSKLRIQGHKTRTDFDSIETNKTYVLSLFRQVETIALAFMDMQLHLSSLISLPRCVLPLVMSRAPLEVIATDMRIDVGNSRRLSRGSAFNFIVFVISLSWSLSTMTSVGRPRLSYFVAFP